MAVMWFEERQRLTWEFKTEFVLSMDTIEFLSPILRDVDYTYTSRGGFGEKGLTIYFYDEIDAIVFRSWLQTL